MRPALAGRAGCGARDTWGELLPQGYERRVAELERERDAARWDVLVEAARGSYLQSRLWADAKAGQGWRATRLVLRDGGGTAVVGAQVLVMTTLLGRLGYVVRGPVCLPGAEPLLSPFVEALTAEARRLRLRYLVLLPPYGTTDDPRTRAWHPAPAFVHPHTEATTVLDLALDDDRLLSGMNGRTRRNVQVAVRRGFPVREAGRDELPLLHHVLTSTGARQGFEVPSLARLREVWDVLHAAKVLRLFLVCDDTNLKQAVSGGLWITHRDTVTYWRGGWAGTHARLAPNQGMHWAVAKWARAQGFRHYDLEGIFRTSAQAVLAGVPVSEVDSVDAFKLGFGGQVLVSPPALGLVPSALVRPLLVPALSAADRLDVGRQVRGLVRR